MTELINMGLNLYFSDTYAVLNVSKCNANYSFYKRFFQTTDVWVSDKMAMPED